MITRLLYFFDKKISASARISALASVKKTTVGEKCAVGKYCNLKNSYIGERCRIYKRARIYGSSLSGFNTVGTSSKLKNVSLGVHSYVSKNTSLAEITVGKFCSIGPDVKNHLANHPTNVFVSTHPAFYSPNSPTDSFSDQLRFNEYGENVTVGNDVWIGAESLLMDGIKIGNGAIVAARSVVTKDVPPYAIVGGTPARIIRYRFDDGMIELLDESQWWDWDLADIRNSAHLFQDVKDFSKMIQHNHTH